MKLFPCQEKGAWVLMRGKYWAGEEKWIFFSSVHQFCCSQLLSQWILCPPHIPENPVSAGMAGDRTCWEGHLEDSLGSSLEGSSAISGQTAGGPWPRRSGHLSSCLQPQILPYFPDVTLPLAEIRGPLGASLPGLLPAPSPAATSMGDLSWELQERWGKMLSLLT